MYTALARPKGSKTVVNYCVTVGGLSDDRSTYDNPGIHAEDKLRF